MNWHFVEIFTSLIESFNHRIIKVGRCLWHSSGPASKLDWVSRALLIHVQNISKVSDSMFL